MPAVGFAQRFGMKKAQNCNFCSYPYSYRPSPFFVLDEIDAALDTKNCAKVVNFLIERSASVQTIAISLKETLYCRADTIVGVFSSVRL